MNDVPSSGVSKARCVDQTYRLSVYEAGHALISRALGLRIITIQMLPRPPILISEKAFAADKWDAFIETLEIRIIELFGGQIAEEHACGTNSCCSGDIARIDELSRLVSGLRGTVDSETVMFDLEDAARDIFADPAYRDAIIPVADFLFGCVSQGREIIDGEAIEVEISKYIPAKAPQNWLKKVFSRD